MMESLRRLIEQHNSVHVPDPRPNVLLFSTPRSGSTWLMELILTQSGFKPCDEPFDLRQEHVNRYLSQVGVSEWEHLYDRAHAEILADYLRGVADGRIHVTDRFFFRNRFRILTRRVVFKILHAGEDRINRWRDTCNARVLYLIRHPLPVSLSRKSLPRLATFLGGDYGAHFDREQVRLGREIAESGTHLERSVLDWCFQNALPLRQRTSDWTVVSYEQLVLDPLPLIDRLCDALHLGQPARMQRRLGVASASSRQSDARTRDMLRDGRLGADNRTRLLEKWRAQIDEDQEGRLMEILSHFGLDAYRAGSALPHPSLWIGSGKNE